MGRKNLLFILAEDYVYRGNTRYNLRTFDHLLKDFDDESSENSGKALAYYVGSAYKITAEYDKALEDFGAAIKLNGRSGIYYNRGLVYFDNGEFDNAISDYSKAIELDQNNIAAYNNRGLAYALIGEHEKAEIDFNKVLKLDATNPYALHNRGNTFFKTDRFNKAITDFNAAKIFASGYADVYYGIARANSGELESGGKAEPIVLTPTLNLATTEPESAFDSIRKSCFIKKVVAGE